ncbi:MAG: histidine triad nucleotide-binding protein [Clostridia bacterium]|nr:histidine triad nucleotide-binding protein [Clostridia bacterium]
MENCIFCKIAAGEIPSKKIYEDEKVMAFYDIAPAAPVHVLVIPKEHVLESAREITGEHAALIGHIYQVIARLASELGLDCGYRVVTNVGSDAGQTVMHLHFHLLGGKLGPMA